MDYQILVGARFSTPIQTSPETHPAFCTVGTGSSPGVKQLGHGVDHPLSSRTKVKEIVELYTCCLAWLSWPVLG